MAMLKSMTAGLLCAALSFVPVLAQTAEPPVPARPAPPKLDPKACADGNRMTRDDTVGGAARPDENLSEKLARTDGVICPPPSLDPNIRAPAPDGGVIQVIPPPGSPGGDPTVRPK